MPSWLNLALDLWPIASTLTPLVLLGGFYWLRTKFPTKEEFAAFTSKVDEIELVQVDLKRTVGQLHSDREAQPTRIELLERISAVEASVSRLDAGLHGVSRQLETANDYLQILVERGLGR